MLQLLPSGLELGQSRHDLSSLQCPLTASQQNEGSLQASQGVTWYLVSGYLTSASPKWRLHPKFTTLATGDPARIATSCDITTPHLSTLTGVFRVSMIFSYSFNAIGSCFSPCSTYLEENGFGLMRSAANFSWCRCLLLIRWKFEVLNWYLHSSFQCLELHCSLAAASMMLISFSSTSSFWRNSF